MGSDLQNLDIPTMVVSSERVRGSQTLLRQKSQKKRVKYMSLRPRSSMLSYCEFRFKAWRTRSLISKGKCNNKNALTECMYKNSLLHCVFGALENAIYIQGGFPSQFSPSMCPGPLEIQIHIMVCLLVIPTSLSSVKSAVMINHPRIKVK